MLFEAVSLGASSFTISAAGTLWYNSFNPTIPTTAVVTSTNDVAINRVYYAKPSQPEHVPLTQYFDIGSRSKSIVRIIALRDALLVFKQDGLYRIIGDGAGNFAVSLMDASVRLASPTYWSFGVLNNRVYCHTLNGAVSISETQILPIDDAVANLFRIGTEGGNTSAVVVSETDQLVYFFFTSSLDTLVTDQAAVFSSRTKAWTHAGGSLVLSQSPYEYQGVTISGLVYRWNTSGSIFKDDVCDANENTFTKWYQVGAPPPAHKMLVNVTAVGASLSVSQFDFTLQLLRIALGFVASNSAYTLYIKANDGGSEIFQITACTGAAFDATGDLTLATSPFTTLAAALNTYFVTGHAYIWVSPNPYVEWLPMSSDTGASQRVSEVSVCWTVLAP
jgi:hypothetical protein